MSEIAAERERRRNYHKLLKLDALAARPGTPSEGENASSKAAAFRKKLGLPPRAPASEILKAPVGGPVPRKRKRRKTWSTKVEIDSFPSSDRIKLEAYLAAVLNDCDFWVERTRPETVPLDDWVMAVSILRRHAYAVAEASAMIGLCFSEIKDMGPTVVRKAGHIRLGLAVHLSPASRFDVAYSLHWARYSDHPALTNRSIEHVGDFLRETGAMAASLFNDVDYLDFIYSLCQGSKLSPILKTAFLSERAYAALRWNDARAAQTVSEVRRRARLPFLYLDGSRVTQKQLSPLTWDAGIALALTEDARWRDARNPIAYLRLTSRNFLRKQALEMTDTEEWVKAREAGIRLRSLTSDFGGGEDLTPLAVLDSDHLEFDFRVTAELAGFDPAMIAYVEAAAADIARVHIAEHLNRKSIPTSQRTGDPWTYQKVDAARKRVETHRDKFRDAVLKTGILRPGINPDLIYAPQVPDAGGGIGDTGMDRGEGYGDGKRPSEWGVGCDSSWLISGSLNNYKQRFFPTDRWTYAHVYDDGNGKMRLPKRTFEYPRGRQLPEYGGSQSSVAYFGDQGVVTLSEWHEGRPKRLNEAARDEVVPPSQRAIDSYRRVRDQMRADAALKLSPSIPATGCRYSETDRDRESRFWRLTGKGTACFSADLLFDKKLTWDGRWGLKEAVQRDGLHRVIDAGQNKKDYGAPNLTGFKRNEDADERQQRLFNRPSRLFRASLGRPRILPKRQDVNT